MYFYIIIFFLYLIQNQISVRGKYRLVEQGRSQAKRRLAISDGSSCMVASTLLLYPSKGFMLFVNTILPPWFC